MSPRYQLQPRDRHIIERTARALHNTLPPAASIEIDDLMQAGTVGVIQYANPAGASAAYVARRARGAMLREISDYDPLTDDRRRRTRAIDKARTRLARRSRRRPTEDEIAAEAGLTPWRYRMTRLVQHRAYHRAYRDDESDDGPPSPVADELRLRYEPSAIVADADMRAVVRAAVAALPERERVLIDAVYRRGMAMQSAGVLIGRAESNTHALRHRALARLRMRIGLDRRM